MPQASKWERIPLLASIPEASDFENSSLLETVTKGGQWLSLGALPNLHHDLPSRK